MRYVYMILVTLLLLAGCAAPAGPQAAEPKAATAAATLPPPTSSPVPSTATAVNNATATATETAAATATSLPTPSPLPSPTPVAGPFANPQRVLSTGSNAWESAFIDPGGVVFHEGQFHMFYNGIRGWPAHVGVGYATSPDGVNWTRMTDKPVFTGEGIDYTGVSIFVDAAVVLDDGTWALYFYTIDTGNFSGPGKIGRATAASPLGPFVADPTPVLLPGPEGAWDEHAVLHPDVVQTENGYVMYYDGNSGDSAERRDRKIGMALSPDGAVWTKYNVESTTAAVVAESDPVFESGPFGSWDRDRVYAPNVVRTEDGWLMVYFSDHFNNSRQRREYRMGTAVSADGINWERTGEEPILTTVDQGWLAFYLASLLHHDDTFYLYFDVQPGQGSRTAVYLATYLPNNGE